MLSEILPLSDPHAEERDIIDQEIAYLLDKVRVLSSRRNRLAPISRLPPELLIRIFLSFQDITLAQVNQFYYKWTIILQISSEWREIALNSPTLWTRIILMGGYRSLSQLEWATTSFSRSGAAPLWLDFQNINMDMQSMEFILSVLSQMHRIAVANIEILWGEAKSSNWRRLKECLEMPAPMVEKVSLRSNKGGSMFPQVDLFGGQAPMLQELSLWHFSIDWNHSPVDRLTHLYLTMFDGYSGNQIPFQDLITTLSTTTLLQSLEVTERSITYDQLAPPSHVHRSISLPHLNVLTFALQWQGCVAFFRAVSIPSRTIIQITMPPFQHADENWVLDWDDLFGPMSKSFIDGVVPFDRMEIVLSDVSGFSTVELSESSVLLFGMKFHSDDPVICAGIQKNFAINHLHTLSLCAHATPESDLTWNVHDFVLPRGLAHFRVVGPFVGWILDTLQKDPGCVPNLQCLSVVFYWHDDTQIPNVLGEVRNSLQMRHHLCGTKLKELHLESDWLFRLQNDLQVTLDAIKECVDEVIVEKDVY